MTGDTPSWRNGNLQMASESQFLKILAGHQLAALIISRYHSARQWEEPEETAEATLDSVSELLKSKNSLPLFVSWPTFDMWVIFHPCFRERHQYFTKLSRCLKANFTMATFLQPRCMPCQAETLSSWDEGSTLKSNTFNYLGWFLSLVVLHIMQFDLF